MLQELDETDVLIRVKKKTQKGYDIISSLDTLIKYEYVDQITDAKQNLGRYIQIRLNPYVWIDNHGSHYISKPANWQNILRQVPKKDRKLFDLFISITLCDCPKYERKNTKNPARSIKKSIEGWAVRLNMTGYLHQRKLNCIKKRLNALVQYAMSSNLLEGAEWSDDGKDQFLRINVAKI